eukprot:gb/GECG01008159.1/.p1 GENE.gb/GECG01008159.1/~~gb/GECG01008159.1/.p1  ORF type:complete len:396 (+),score=31.57 gb/GECG01008159.1/:1-1188(+)
MEAPLIRHVHTRNGETSSTGGLIVWSKQKFFKVDSCSSSGIIRGDQTPRYSPWLGGGGIADFKSASGGGSFTISSSQSTGNITGGRAGGIVGISAATLHGVGSIIACFSAGVISGNSAGGIAGSGAGVDEGQLDLFQCFSSGDVDGDWSGGLAGNGAGWRKGSFFAKQCFSLGHINGKSSGGLVGKFAAGKGGNLVVTECYSKGNICGDDSGGICGDGLAGSGGRAVIRNTYASGHVSSNVQNTGGIAGGVRANTAFVAIKYSVYSGDGGISGRNDQLIESLETNSGKLNRIRGQLYSYNGTQMWSNETWFVEAPQCFPRLRFERSFIVTSAKPTKSPDYVPSGIPPAPPPVSSVRATSTPFNTITNAVETLPPSSPTASRGRKQLPAQRPRRYT